MKLFEFKEDLYTFSELFKAHLGNKNLYQEGEVVNHETGESFDISEIHDVKGKYYEELINIKNTLQDTRSSRIVWALTEDEKDKKIKELNAKFKNGNIDLDEMEWLLKLENNVKFDEKFYVIINKRMGTFYKKYNSFSYPENLSHADIGKLHLLLDFMTYDNEIRRTNRKNAKFPTTQELMSFMRITNESSLTKFIKKLKNCNIIAEDIRKKDHRIIYINPLFCDRNIKIYPDLYKAFRESLDGVLSTKEIKYLELMEEDMKGGSLTINTKKS